MAGITSEAELDRKCAKCGSNNIVSVLQEMPPGNTNTLILPNINIIYCDDCKTTVHPIMLVQLTTSIKCIYCDSMSNPGTSIIVRTGSNNIYCCKTCADLRVKPSASPEELEQASTAAMEIVSHVAVSRLPLINPP